MRPVLIAHEGEPLWIGFRVPETPSKAAVPREPGEAQPTFALWRAGGRGLKRLALLSRSEARWGCGLLPRRVSLCRMQLPEARFGRSVGRGLGAERPSWLRGHCWAQGSEGLRGPSPACPRRRTRGEWVSGARDPQQSSSAQGARGSPTPLRPMESVGTGAKTACTAFLSRGALGLWFAAR